eukprot:s274_g21.t1
MKRDQHIRSHLQNGFRRSHEDIQFEFPPFPQFHKQEQARSVTCWASIETAQSFRASAPMTTGAPDQLSGCHYMRPTLSLPRAPLEPLHRRQLPRVPISPRPKSSGARRWRRPMGRVMSRQEKRSCRDMPWVSADMLLEQSELYRSKMSSGSAFFSLQSQSEHGSPKSPSSPSSPTSPSSICTPVPRPSAPEPVELGSFADETRPASPGERLQPVEAWEAEDLGGSFRSADFQRDTPITSSTPSPLPSTPPPVCSLASSAQQFMQRKRQAAEQESMQQTEWQHFIRKRNSLSEDSEDDTGGPMVRAEKSTRPTSSGPGPPLSIAELYQLCNQISKTMLVPIAEVKACFDDFISLDLDGSFTLSADEFEKAVRRSCRMTENEMLPENLALKYPQMDSDGNRVVDFKEYVRWCQGASWSEQLLVRDDRDREARRLARVYGIHLLDVERLRRLFDSYTTQETSRVITQDRFSQACGPRDVERQIFRACPGPK